MKRLLLLIPFLTLGCAAMEPASPALEEIEPIERKTTENAAYSITDIDGTHELSAKHHLLLMQCQTYKDNFSETKNKPFDISSSIAPNATHANILKLIDIIENPKRIKELNKQEIMDLFGLANYLDAPEKEVTQPLAEQCHALLMKKKEELNKQGKDLSYLEKVLLREAENYLFYETFTDFFADYTKKMATIELNPPLKFNFSYAHLKSLGFIKKIKSLKGLREFLYLHGWNNPFVIKHIDLSSHAIEDFNLNDFGPIESSRPLCIDLSNNRIQTLKPEQLNSLCKNLTLILDGNPLSSVLIDFTNLDFFLRLALQSADADIYPVNFAQMQVNISLKNISLSAHSLAMLPPKQPIIQKMQLSAATYLTNAPVFIDSYPNYVFILLGWVGSWQFAKYINNKKLIKNQKLNNALFWTQFITGSALLLTAYAEAKIASSNITHKFDQTTKAIITTDYGTHILRIP